MGPGSRGCVKKLSRVVEHKPKKLIEKHSTLQKVSINLSRHDCPCKLIDSQWFKYAKTTHNLLKCSSDYTTQKRSGKKCIWLSETENVRRNVDNFVHGTSILYARDKNSERARYFKFNSATTCIKKLDFIYIFN